MAKSIFEWKDYKTNGYITNVNGVCNRSIDLAASFKSSSKDRWYSWDVNFQGERMTGFELSKDITKKRVESAVLIILENLIDRIRRELNLLICARDGESQGMLELVPKAFKR